MFVTLIGVYFGCWEVTKRLPHEDLVREVRDGHDDFALIEICVPAPFVVSVEWSYRVGWHSAQSKRYYLWLPGKLVQIHEYGIVFL